MYFQPLQTAFPKSSCVSRNTASTKGFSCSWITSLFVKVLCHIQLKNICLGGFAQAILCHKQTCSFFCQKSPKNIITTRAAMWDTKYCQRANQFLIGNKRPKVTARCAQGEQETSRTQWIFDQASLRNTAFPIFAQCIQAKPIKSCSRSHIFLGSHRFPSAYRRLKVYN